MAEQEAAAEQAAEQGQESAEIEEAPPEELEDEQDGGSDRAERFFAAADAVRAAISDRPTLDLPELLSLEEQSAIEELYAARTAEPIDIGDGHISAIQRGKLLNQALATLQPVLALGRFGAIPEGRAAYVEVEEKIAQLRRDITTQGGVEAVIFPPATGAAGQGDEDEEDAEKDEDR